MQESTTDPSVVPAPDVQKKPIWPFALGAMIAVTSLVTLSRGYRESNSIPLRVEPPVYDAGVIKEGVVSAPFKIRNLGDHAYQVVSVSRSCDCTDVKVPLVELKPGAELSLACLWNTFGRKGETTSLFAVRFVKVQDESQKEHDKPPVLNVIMKLHASVTPIWWLDPSEVVFEQGETAVELRVHSTPGEDFRLLGAASDSPAVAVLVSPLGRSAIVSLDRSQWQGTSSAKISLTSDCSSKRDVDCRVYVRGP
jgi:hypothetical protein